MKKIILLLATLLSYAYQSKAQESAKETEGTHGEFSWVLRDSCREGYWIDYCGDLNFRDTTDMVTMAFLLNKNFLVWDDRYNLLQRKNNVSKIVSADYNEVILVSERCGGGTEVLALIHNNRDSIFTGVYIDFCAEPKPAVIQVLTRIRQNKVQIGGFGYFYFPKYELADVKFKKFQ